MDGFTWTPPCIINAKLYQYAYFGGSAGLSGANNEEYWSWKIKNVKHKKKDWAEVGKEKEN